MEDFFCLVDIVVVGFDNGLVVEVDVDDWQFVVYMGQQFWYVVGFVWCIWVWGEYQYWVVYGVQMFNQCLCWNGVVINYYVMVVGVQLVCQVIGKGIDIIEQQNVSYQKIFFV